MTPQQTPAQRARELRESLRLAGELADALATQADRVRAQCQQLEVALSGLDALETPPPEATEPEALDQPHDPYEPLRLAAMEMALQGRSRAEIGAYLRRTLDEDVVEELLGAVLDDRG